MKNPPATLHPHTDALARRIVADGGMVGLGWYVWNPSAESWGASFAEVEVDMETGRVSVLKLVGVHDCGRVIHVPGAVAQVDGGSIMGLGYTMTEELLIDPHTGIPVTQSLYEYRPPTILDLPELIPILVEAPVAAGPFGAKGLGENPMFNAGCRGRQRDLQRHGGADARDPIHVGACLRRAQARGKAGVRHVADRR